MVEDGLLKYLMNKTTSPVLFIKEINSQLYERLLKICRLNKMKYEIKIILTTRSDAEKVVSDMQNDDWELDIKHGAVPCQ